MRTNLQLRIGQMLAQDRMIDIIQCLGVWEADRKHAEVSLQSRIYGKTSRSWIHAGYVLGVVYVF